MATADELRAQLIRHDNACKLCSSGHFLALCHNRAQIAEALAKHLASETSKPTTVRR